MNTALPARIIWLSCLISTSINAPFNAEHRISKETEENLFRLVTAYMNGEGRKLFPLSSKG